jgi:hypothetical protein
MKRLLTSEVFIQVSIAVYVAVKMGDLHRKGEWGECACLGSRAGNVRLNESLDGADGGYC